MKAKESKKTKQISADLNIEDFELLEKTKEERKLPSNRETFAVIFKGYLQSLNPAAHIDEKTEKATCVYLSKDDAYCCKNAEKITETSPAYCEACKLAEKLAAEAAQEDLNLALEIWKKLTGQQGFLNRSLGLMKIQLLIAQKNEDVEIIKEEAAICPKCGVKILQDDDEKEP